MDILYWNWKITETASGKSSEIGMFSLVISESPCYMSFDGRTAIGTKLWYTVDFGWFAFWVMQNSEEKTLLDFRKTTKL